MFRTTLLAIAMVFGALGIFLLSHSRISAPVGDYAAGFVATAWAISSFGKSTEGT